MRTNDSLPTCLKLLLVAVLGTLLSGIANAATAKSTTTASYSIRNHSQAPLVLQLVESPQSQQCIALKQDTYTVPGLKTTQLKITLSCANGTIKSIWKVSAAGEKVGTLVLTATLEQKTDPWPHLLFTNIGCTYHGTNGFYGECKNAKLDNGKIDVNIHEDVPV